MNAPKISLPVGGEMKVWIWLLTAIMGLTVSLGGIVYGNIIDVNRHLEVRVEAVASSQGTQDKEIVGMKKDNEVLQRDVKELKQDVKEGFDTINRRLDVILPQNDSKGGKNGK